MSGTFNGGTAFHTDGTTVTVSALDLILSAQMSRALFWSSREAQTVKLSIRVGEW